MSGSLGLVFFQLEGSFPQLTAESDSSPGGRPSHSLSSEKTSLQLDEFHPGEAPSHVAVQALTNSVLRTRCLSNLKAAKQD